MYAPIETILGMAREAAIAPERIPALNELIAYIQAKRDAKEAIHLNFICTHNSRRSQFAQVWAQVAAAHYGIPVHSYSGGVEVTAFNPRAVQSLQRFGFEVKTPSGENPHYQLKFAETASPIVAFSKLFDDPANPTEGFAAVMTCGHADENCPFVPGCEKRIAVRYDDPKAFDDTPLETAMYDYRSFQIATELMYVFAQIK